jgi:hypothetical protein
VTGATMTGVDPVRVAGVLAQSDEADWWLRRLLAAERRAYDLGRQDGYREGRQAEAAERDQAWNSWAAPLARRLADGVDLQARRWKLRGEPRTRETFGLPHPGDRHGGDG